MPTCAGSCGIYAGKERLAEQIGVSTQFLLDAERGVTGMSVTTIIKLCNVLSVSADFLLLGRDGSGNGWIGLILLLTDSASFRTGISGRSH